MTKSIRVTCGTCRHPQEIPVSHVTSIEDTLDDGLIPEFVCLKLKPGRWIQDTWGDRQWHGNVVAEREDVARLIWKRLRNAGG